jgi:MFS family permease
MRRVPDPRAPVDRFILLYALAWAGGTIGYVPLLSILLPVQVAGLAGKTAGVDWLAYIALIGAIAASLAGILFGYLSDVTRNRRGWIVAGLALSCTLLLVIGRMTSLPEIVAAIVVWQLGLNMMLGPLAAWAGDVVPDDRKGLLGGLMAFAPGLGALAGALVTIPGLADGQARLGLVATLVALCVVPVLLQGPPAGAVRVQAAVPPEPQRARRLALRMWLARLAVQVAEATLFAYLFFWLVGLDGSVSDNQTARLFSVILLVSAPLALLVGRWSDRTDRPIMPLQACALISALGLVGMALAPDITGAMLAYGLFGVSSAVFLALHSAQTLRILPRPDRRGRDLGLFNLANTVPSLVMPWLTMAIVPVAGYPALFALLAGLAALSGLLLRNINPAQ